MENDLMANTGFACPTCDLKEITSPLRNGGNGFTCGNGHVFNDTEQLLSMRPRTIDVPKPPRPPREGMIEFKTSLPAKLVEALRSRFGDKLAGAIECILAAILDPGSFLVTGFDVDRLKQHFGQAVKDSGQLVGLIVSMKMERDTALQEASASKTTTPTGAVEVNEVQGDFVQVSLRIPVEEFLEIKDKAKFNGAAPSAFISQMISHAILNKWV